MFSMNTSTQMSIRGVGTHDLIRAALGMHWDGQKRAMPADAASTERYAESQAWLTTEAWRMTEGPDQNTSVCQNNLL